jgi:hypothetical protein
MKVEQFTKTESADGRLSAEARVNTGSRRFDVTVSRPGGIGFIDTLTRRCSGECESIPRTITMVEVS